MRNNKNALIIALLAIVLVMAVGYAAFATTLTINGTANISSSWNVHFDHTTTGYNTAYVVTPATGRTFTSSDANPSMTVTDNTATLSTSLKQPGDYVTFTLTIKNEGTVGASLGTASYDTSNSTCTVNAGNNRECISGNIKFTIGNFSKTSLAAVNGSTIDSATITVKAEFVNNEITSYTTTETASAKITFTANQV